MFDLASVFGDSATEVTAVGHVADFEVSWAVVLNGVFENGGFVFAAIGVIGNDFEVVLADIGVIDVELLGLGAFMLIAIA